MKHYETPEMKIIELELTDIITNSPGVESDDNPVDKVPGGGNTEWV